MNKFAQTLMIQMQARHSALVQQSAFPLPSVPVDIGHVRFVNRFRNSSSSPSPLLGRRAA